MTAIPADCQAEAEAAMRSGVWNGPPIRFVSICSEAEIDKAWKKCGAMLQAASMLRLENRWRAKHRAS